MTKEISQNDFKRQWSTVGDDVLAAVERVGRGGRFILGDEVARFEEALARSWGVRHTVGVANGLDAIEIALRSLDLQRGETVLTAPLSAFATAIAIIRAGGVPVFVDVDDNGLIDLQQCRELLARERSIRFLLPIHMYGFVVDLEELERLKRDFELRVVEDCAQSIGATYGDEVTGSVGQISATSFYPTKNLGALGDAGAVLTKDDALAARARMLRNTGRAEHHLHVELGLNSRLDELHAAILRDALLPRLAEWTSARRLIAEKYRAAISNPELRMLCAGKKVDPGWHLFPITVANGKRDAFRAHLHSLGILTSVHYPLAMCDQPALESSGEYELAFAPTNARRIAAAEVSLPIHPFLTSTEVSAVIDACNSWDG